MMSVRPCKLPTLKNWTSLLPLSFCGVRVALAEGGEDGTRASMWYAKRDYRRLCEDGDRRVCKHTHFIRQDKEDTEIL
jgi:hypothetical protein